MKRKAAKGKAKPLRYDAVEVFLASHQLLPPEGSGVARRIPTKRRPDVFGITLPPNLMEIAASIGDERAAFFRKVLPHLGTQSPEWEIAWIAATVSEAVREGFNIALLRYADDLKAVPEAAAILKAMKSGPKKAGEVIRKKAAPKRMDVRRRYRELRKSGFSKTEARRIIHQDTGFSIRQIERDTAGLS